MSQSCARWGAPTRWRNGSVLFFFFPVGHDQAVYTRPWITLSLIATCFAVHLWVVTHETARERAHDLAWEAAADWAESHPESRIAPETFEALPLVQQPTFRDLVAWNAIDPAVDPELELLVLDVGRAWRRQLMVKLGDVPAEHRVWPMVTSTFLHGDWDHLFGNMLILYLLGSVLECFWSAPAYLLLYFGAALFSAALEHLFMPDSLSIHMGASGAISGVMAAFVIGHRHARIHFRYFIWYLVFMRWGVKEVPATLLIGLWAVLQVWLLWTDEWGQVSYLAHIGGFVSGLLITALAMQRRWIAKDAGFA